MNILFVQNDLFPASGGIAIVSSLLRKYLVAHGHDVYFLYYLSDDEDIDVSHKYKYNLTMNGQNMYSQVSGFVKQIPGGVNVVIIQGLFFKSISQTFVRLRKECGFRLIACLHCNPAGLLPPPSRTITDKCKNLLRVMTGRTLKSAMRTMCEQADEMVLESDSYCADMEQYYGNKNHDNLKAIPNPLTFETFADDEQIMSKKKMVLIIARLHDATEP